MSAQLPQDSPSAVLALLTRLLASDVRDRDAELEALCSANPAQASQLRHLYEQQRRVGRIFRRLGVGGTRHARRPGCAQALRAGSRIGPFALETRIGSGAMGEVWRARDETGALVALKLMHSPLTRDARAVLRFRREADAGQKLSHPSVVRVLSAGLADDYLFIAQDLVEGSRSLAEWLAQVARVDDLPRRHFDHVARIARQAAEGLQHAHEHGVIHRDVKPQNMLVDATGRCRIIDFGLALVCDGFLVSHTGDVTGTVAYMSPEQARRGDLPVDARSDVFSLGSTLYEMLTLRRPFDGDTFWDMLQSVVEREPPRPTEVRSEVPPFLDEVCMRALAKNPGMRFQSMAEFARALARFERPEQRPPALLPRRSTSTEPVLENVRSAVRSSRTAFRTQLARRTAAVVRSIRTVDEASVQAPWPAAQAEFPTDFSHDFGAYDETVPAPSLSIRAPTEPATTTRRPRDVVRAADDPRTVEELRALRVRRRPLRFRGARGRRGRSRRRGGPRSTRGRSCADSASAGMAESHGFFG